MQDFVQIEPNRGIPKRRFVRKMSRLVPSKPYLDFTSGRSAEPSWGEVGRSSRAALILFASHHKTGTALNAALARAMVQARPGTVRLINTGLGDGVKSRGYWWEPAALRSFLEDSPDGVAVGWNEHAYQWPAAEMPAVRCLVHDVRDPVSMVVSAYLYHMRIAREHPHSERLD